MKKSFSLLLAPLALCAQFEIAEARTGGSAGTAVGQAIAGGAGSTVMNDDGSVSRPNSCFESLGVEHDSSRVLSAQIPNELRDKYNSCVEAENRRGKIGLVVTLALGSLAFGAGCYAMVRD